MKLNNFFFFLWKLPFDISNFHLFSVHSRPCPCAIGTDILCAPHKKCGMWALRAHSILWADLWIFSSMSTCVSANDRFVENLNLFQVKTTNGNCRRYHRGHIRLSWPYTAPNNNEHANKSGELPVKWRKWMSMGLACKKTPIRTERF